MIGIINYGLGNVKAISNIFNKIGVDNLFINNAEDFKKITKIILPGVGTFDASINLLKEKNFVNILDDYVMNKKIPILGICIGMQIMAYKSSEGIEKGFGWIPGEIVKFKNESNNRKYRLPHMGWNSIDTDNDILFKNIKNPEFYFLHSYFYKLENINHKISTTNYINEFPSAINNENIFATQFHPEKSHLFGIRLLKNFSDI
tara:strand:- start:206 stop:814 length:609 start_codon:yes stop_codon:yes gene_type:complete